MARADPHPDSLVRWSHPYEAPSHWHRGSPCSCCAPCDRYTSFIAPLVLTAGDEGECYSTAGAFQVTMPLITLVNSGWYVNLRNTGANYSVYSSIWPSLGDIHFIIDGVEYDYFYLSNGEVAQVRYLDDYHWLVTCGGHGMNGGLQ